VQLDVATAELHIEHLGGKSVEHMPTIKNTTA